MVHTPGSAASRTACRKGAPLLIDLPARRQATEWAEEFGPVYRVRFLFYHVRLPQYSCCPGNERCRFDQSPLSEHGIKANSCKSLHLLCL